MASPDVDTNYGATVAFGTSTALNNLELVDLNWSGGSREMIDVTKYGTGAPAVGDIGNAEFIPSPVFDNGSVDMDFHFNPDVVLPVCADAETITITFKSGATWIFSGAIQAASAPWPMKDKMVVTLTVKICGSITPTAAA